VTAFFEFLGVVFAAFCIWLTVRIINRGEKWAKRTLTMIVGVPALYVASFGIFCWVMVPRSTFSEGPVGPRFSTAGGGNRGYSRRVQTAWYRPLFLAASRAGHIGDLLRWYICAGKDDGVVPMYFPDSIEWVVQPRQG